jgi:hypothetical protein
MRPLTGTAMFNGGDEEGYLILLMLVDVTPLNNMEFTYKLGQVFSVILNLD